MTNTREREREKQERKITVNNTSYKHGQASKKDKRDILSLEQERQVREIERRT
jgi:hypothetical protein